MAFLCGGIASASPQDGYATWKTIQAPWYWDKRQYVRQPLSATGDGLPSNFCNAIIAPDDYQLWVGTNSGLGYKVGKNNPLQYVRGMDYAAKNEGLMGGKPPITVLIGSNAKAPTAAVQLLPQDFVTSLYPSADGMWIGFRGRGAVLANPKTVKNAELQMAESPIFKHDAKSAWVSCFVPMPDGKMHVGTYGTGFHYLGQYAAPPKKKPKGASNHPKYPPLPTNQEIDALAAKLDQVAASKPEKIPAGSPTKGQNAYFWFEDWATQGDWCERYGKGYGVLCATNAPESNTDLNIQFDYDVRGHMGPHRREKDDLRHWVHWIDAPKNRNVLYNPMSGTRTEAEWDDHGETYSYTFDGPDIWAIVQVPEGRHLMSLYFYSPNGQAGLESHRDYIIEVRAWKSKYPESVVMGRAWPSDFKLPRDCIWKELWKVMEAPVLARTRVKEFAGTGCYKNFVLDGAGLYYVRVSRNYSCNAILNAIFLSNLDETKNAVDGRTRKPARVYGPAIPGPMSLKDANLSALPASAMNLWSKIIEGTPRISAAAFPALRKMQILTYRNALNNNAPVELLSVWRWQLKLWNRQDKQDFPAMCEASWESSQEVDIYCRSKGWNPYGPHTVPFSVDDLYLMQDLKIDWKLYRDDSKVKPELSVKALKEKLKQIRAEREKEQEQKQQKKKK